MEIQSEYTKLPSSITNETIQEYQGYPHFSFVFDMEKQHDMSYRLGWMKRHWHLSIYMASIYLVGTFLLQSFMKNRQPYNMRKIMFAWNIGMAAFSTCGMYRGMPEILYVVWNYGFRYSLCNNNANAIMGFWGWLFTSSKAVELVETFFIILMKGKLMPLQIIHHTLTLVGTWFSFIFHPSLARYTIAINFSVHAIMYTHLTFKTCRVKVPHWVSFLITTAQIAQMIVGLTAAVACFLLIVTGTPCNTPVFLPGVVAFTYFWLLCLFVNLYKKRYIKPAEKRI